METTNHNKGSRLSTGSFLTVGDFLISPNRRFVGVLEPNGSFAIYWNPLDQVGSDPITFTGQQASRVWWAPGDNPGPHVFVMQEDGNCCTYWGTSLQDHSETPIWASDTPAGKGPTYVAELRNDSSFHVLKDGVSIFDSATRIDEVGLKTCVSGINRSAPTSGVFALSSLPPTGTGTPAQGRASARLLGAEPTDDQVWLRLDWSFRDDEYIGHPRVFKGMVLINRATGLALGSDGRGLTAMTATIDDNALWDQGDPEFGTDPATRMAALRLRRDGRFNLNVKGDPPYASGTEVVLWNWSGPADNLVWRLSPAKTRAPVPA